MNFKNRIIIFFCAFIFLLVLLQLSANKEINFSTAFSFASCVVFTLFIYVNLISTKKIQALFYGKNIVAFYSIFILLCFGVAFVLETEGYIVIKLFLSASTVNRIVSDRGSVFFGLLMFSVLVNVLNYSFEKYKDYLEKDKELETLKRKSLEMEISLLRNQLSPHFTFNILNNLQFLIRKDKDEALRLLSRYSKILRYYVYESQKKSLNLSDEIFFLKEYFDLEINRHVADFQIEYNLEIPQNDFIIVPFILSTFVENAFKHALPNRHEAYFIRQNCSIENNTKLVFEIANTYDQSVNLSNPKGVGLTHVQERLQLMYPQKFELHFFEENEIFRVCLTLNLEKLCDV